MWHWSSDVDRVREGRDGKFTMELPCSSKDLAHGSAHAEEDFCCTMTLVPDLATGSGVPYIAVPPRWSYGRPSVHMLLVPSICVSVDPSGRELTGPALVLAAGQSVL